MDGHIAKLLLRVVNGSPVWIDLRYPFIRTKNMLPDWRGRVRVDERVNAHMSEISGDESDRKPFIVSPSHDKPPLLMQVVVLVIGCFACELF